MKPINNLNLSRAVSWTGVIAILGVVAGYTPAFGNGSSWTLPYTGSASSSQGVFSVTNTGAGWGISATGTSTGLTASGTGSNGTGASGSGASVGIYGYGNGSAASGSVGVQGITTATQAGYGVTGTNGYAGVYGYNNTQGANGVMGGATTGGTGVYGFSAWGVEGQTTASGGIGVVGISSYSGGTALYGAGGGGSKGLYASSDTNYGAEGYSGSNIGVYGYGAIGLYGVGNGSGSNLAASLNGNVVVTGNLQVNGTINKSAVGFKIDHPLDPARKYLMHSCVESDEMMNIYRGSVVLDSDGAATVTMPEWFEAENREFNYQLTPVGKAAPGLYVSREIEKNQFEVSGGAPGMKVCWMVTGARNDRYAQAHPLKIEVDKSASEQGRYIRPEEFGQPESAAIGSIDAPPKDRNSRLTTHPPHAAKLPAPLKVPAAVK